MVRRVGMNNIDEFGNMTTESLLAEVNKAIKIVLIGGQSYKIGSRQLTRADLSELRAMRAELEAELTTGGGGDLFDNTVVAIFDRR